MPQSPKHPLRPQYALDKASYEASEQQVASLGLPPAVTFEPATGTVPPNSSVTLTALFAPREERGYNYNVVCRVAKKPTRLTLNVKGEGYAIHEMLALEGGDGSVVPLAPRGAPNVIDFGQVRAGGSLEGCFIHEGSGGMGLLGCGIGWPAFT